MAYLTYKNENNQVAFQNESGSYKNSSGTFFWPGRILSHEPDDKVGGFEDIYVGTDNRGFDDYTLGPLSHTGTYLIEPQDFRILKYCFGLVTDTGSPNATHTLKQDYIGSLAPETGEFFPSFTAEDYQGYGIAGSNFKRTYLGTMVDEWELSASKGEKAQLKLDYIAGSLVFSSGLKSAVTASTSRSLIWSDFSWYLGGSKLQSPADWSAKGMNHLKADNNSDGSRDISAPVPEGRDYELNIPLKAERDYQLQLYRQYYLGGSSFNMQLICSNAGGVSGGTITFSGCRLTDMTNPTIPRGLTENVLTIHPNQASAIIVDTILTYNAW